MPTWILEVMKLNAVFLSRTLTIHRQLTKKLRVIIIAQIMIVKPKCKRIRSSRVFDLGPWRPCCSLRDSFLRFYMEEKRTLPV